MSTGVIEMQSTRDESGWYVVPARPTDMPSRASIRRIMDEPRAMPFVIPPSGGAIPIID